MANVYEGSNLALEYALRNSPGGYALDPSSMSRDQIKQYQRELNAAGADLSVDGVWGPKTSAAWNKAGTGGAYSSTSMGALPSEFSSMLGQAMSMMNAPKIDYTVPTDEELSAQIEAALRPQYDTAMKNRKTQTTQNRAAADADAAARGMGASTWLTDAKMRQDEYEADDISDMESNYGASKASAVSDLKNAHTTNKLNADMANAQMQQAALQNALDTAMSMYGMLGKGKSGSGGGGGGGDSTEDLLAKYLEEYGKEGTRVQNTPQWFSQKTQAQASSALPTKWSGDDFNDWYDRQKKQKSMADSIFG